jgi:predicted dehydrogenase
VQRIKQALSSLAGPKAFVMTVNAGSLPAEHWTQDRQIGGGRIIGEACHFIDLLRFLSASPIASADVRAMAGGSRDSVAITLTFEDGSLGTIHYLANGSKAFPKERLEVFAGGRVLQLDNYRVLRGFGWPGVSTMRLWRQDKGQGSGAQVFVDAVRQGAASPIPFDELLEVSRWSIDIAGRV